MRAPPLKWEQVEGLASSGGDSRLNMDLVSDTVPVAGLNKGAHCIAASIENLIIGDFEFGCVPNGSCSSRVWDCANNVYGKKTTTKEKVR
jgi:hypothetical protein